MIVVDTNVLSEFMKPTPVLSVVKWFASQSDQDLCTTAITEAELLVGVTQMPEGKRKVQLAIAIEAMLNRFSPRILPFDRDAAREYPFAALGRFSAGLDSDTADIQIAAVARLHGAAVATRNVRHFEHTGVQIIDPWMARIP